MAKSKSQKQNDNGPGWPSIEKQLAESKVVHGSALYKLVLDNQDFELLYPGEAHDDIRIPLWLRVYWKKHHPEDKYPANDPSGGYPMALRDMYKWMIAYQDLPGVEFKPVKKGGGHGK